MQENRRRSPRYPSVHFAAGDGLMFRTVDLSRDGMMIEMETAPPLGSSMDLQVAFGEQVVRLPGRVVRHAPLPRSRVGIGVDFGALEPASRRIVDEYCS